MSHPKRKYINSRGKLLDLTSPVAMGILNVTPDSFFNGGKYIDEETILVQTKKMLYEGATIIDIGAQSTRPNATLISSDVEWKRLFPVIKFLRNNFPETVFSVDTFYAGVAEKSIDEGADIINDISAGTMDEKMFDVIAKCKISYVMMHMQGTPQTMQQNPQYKNVVNEVMDFFIEKIKWLTDKGLTDIIIDPGFGFGKTLEHNYELFNNLELFGMLERPILAGLSRKSMVNKILNVKAEDALNGTTVLNTIALMKGANILRVHDVKEAMETIRLVEKLFSAEKNKLPTSILNS